MTTPAAVEVTDIKKSFGAVVALGGVSFRIEPGELFFLLGPSGCGKTTLLRILAGLETQDSGAVKFSGEDMAGREPHLRGAPMVFQNYALWPHLSVADNIAFGLVERNIPRAERKTRVEEALSLVGLAGLGSRMPGQLSGGQQQRVVLGRALVLKPKLVLLDEPLSNLDAKLRHEMREELERLHRETDITFVYVTHDQSEALALADRMAVLRDGQIAALGKPGELYRRPTNAFCASFLGEANLLPAKVLGWEGSAARVATPLGEWRALAGDGFRPAPGAEALCFFRPENLRPGAEAGASLCNRFDAKVERNRLNGGTLTVTLSASGQELRSTLLNRGGLELDSGHITPWVVQADDALLLPKES